MGYLIITIIIHVMDQNEGELRNITILLFILLYIVYYWVFVLYFIYLYLFSIEKPYMASRDMKNFLCRFVDFV